MSDSTLNGGYLLVNARMTLGQVRFGDDSELSFSIWGKNLTDEEYQVYDFDASGRGLTGAHLGYFNEPRSYGAEVSIRF